MAECPLEARPKPTRRSSPPRRSGLKRARGDAAKWRAMAELLRAAGSEKVVLFCQPAETVAVVAREIEVEIRRAPRHHHRWADRSRAGRAGRTVPRPAWRALISSCPPSRRMR